MKPYYEQDGIRIYHGDCLEILPAITDRPTSLVTDPPFSFAGGISNGRSSLASDQFFEHWWRDVCGLLSKILSDKAEGFIWCDWRTVNLVANCWQPKGHTYDALFRVPQVIYHYREMPGQGSPFRNSVDLIAYLRGANSTGSRISKSTHNFISRYWYYGKHEYHPAEKDPEICRQLIEWSTGSDGLVIDPFMGSGTTLIAARQLGARAIGIEIEEHFCETAASRLSQQSLFPMTLAIANNIKEGQNELSQ